MAPPDAGSTLAGSSRQRLSCIHAEMRRGLLPPTSVSGLAVGLKSAASQALPLAVNRFRDPGASQTTMCGFIPLQNELISLGTHKKSMRLVIDPTIDPVSRRYDQADILAPGEECSLDCDVVIDRAVSRRLRPGPTWSGGDALEDIWI